MTAEIKVDVAVNVYGKPYQTVLSILSLLKYSKKHINKIYINIEKKQPSDFDETILKELPIDIPLIFYTPKLYLGWGGGLSQKPILYSILCKFDFFRHSIRYQYAWEKSTAKYLFIMHNDIVFHKDIIGNYLNSIDDKIAVGSVGQCWNCPAYEKYCDSEKYLKFRPSNSQLIEMYNGWHVNRAVIKGLVSEKGINWPLPECRLNEMAALFNLEIAKNITMPSGKVVPFGTFALDTGTLWFQQISLLGYEVRHNAFSNYATHGLFNITRSGHGSLSDKKLYDEEEFLAKNMIDNKEY